VLTKLQGKLVIRPNHGAGWLILIEKRAIAGSGNGNGPD
jgi:hypothetical protein